MSASRASLALALAVALVAASLAAGCIRRGGDEPVADATAGGVVISNQTLEKIEAVAAKKPSRFAFPVASPPPERVRVTWVNGTVGPEANAAVEFPQDRGGTSANTFVLATDVSSFVPPDQPTLINLRLWYDNKPGASADLDVHVKAHGVETHVAKEYFGEMAWTLPVKTKSVTTIGLEPTLVGVQVANGRIAPGNALSYWMRVEFIYGEDVAAPKVPYALDVPANASGLIVESVKFAGDTHVSGRFVVVSPDNTLVAAQEFDDIAIPTQSVYVPLPGPGRYVFYVVDVKNGFFGLRADAPLDDHVAKPLPRVVTDTVLITDPVAPGVAAHTLAPTPYTEGASVPFSVDGNFPLEVWAFLTGDGATGDVQLVVSSAHGAVAEYHRFARYDGDPGRVGVSDEDLPANKVFRPEHLATGAHTLSAVVNGMTGQAGVRVVTWGS